MLLDYFRYRIVLDGRVERSGIGGEYSDCFDPTYARMVVLGYMDRYATPDRLGRAVTQKDIAFLHNGGPEPFGQRVKVEQLKPIGQGSTHNAFAVTLRQQSESNADQTSQKNP